VPLLTGGATSLRPGFLYEYFFETGFTVPTLVALRRGGYKLVRYPGHSAWDELFDFTADPSEIRNLIHDPGSQGILTQLSTALSNEKTAVKYRVPPYADAAP
jgi:hypothetical protein